MKKAYLVSAMILALAACSQPEVPTDRYYRLQLAAPSAPMRRVVLKGTLEVERFIANGLIAGRPILHSQAGKPNEIREYNYHFWTEPPIVLLRDQLVTYLRAVKIADVVVTPEVRIAPDYVITGKIKRLEKIDGERPKAVVELELALRKTAGGKLLYLDSFRVETEAADNSVAAAIEALNAALDEIYGKFTAAIAKL
ncbi:MAG TPA: ABC transporter [Rhodospirillales bacterium]|nr:ABC transporter [Rhodospirillales bacterium]